MEFASAFLEGMIWDTSAEAERLWRNGLIVRVKDKDRPVMRARRVGDSLVFRVNETPEPYIEPTYKYSIVDIDPSWEIISLADLIPAELPITNNAIMVGVPMERSTMNEWLHCRDAILTHMHRAGQLTEPSMYQAEGHRVDRNRDEIVSFFMEHPQQPDWLLFLDSDMEHPIDIGDRLTRWGKMVVGGLYFHRGDHRPLVFRKGAIAKNRWWQDVQMSDYMDKEIYDYLMRHDVPMRDGAVTLNGVDEDSLLECDQVGTGALLIHRCVLEALKPTPERPIPWFQYSDGTRSEDIEFCERVREELGVQVYCDLSTISGHYKNVPMGQTQFRMFYEGRGLAMTTYTPTDAAHWLSTNLNITPDEALKRIKEYKPTMMADHWNHYKEMADFTNGSVEPEEYKYMRPTTAAEVEDFYEDEKTGELYLLDLLIWNSTTVFQALRKMLMNVHGARVLEVGAGIGTLALQLIVQGNDVTAVEPNDRLRTFIQKRYDGALEHDIMPPGSGALKVVKALGDVQDEFDMACAMDVLEHIHPDELGAIVKQIADRLPLNGRLWTHNNWYQQERFPMHYDHSALWEKCLNAAGMQMLDEYWAVKVSEKAL